VCVRGVGGGGGWGGGGGGGGAPNKPHYISCAQYSIITTPPNVED